MARLSIIIPALGNVSALEDTLVSVLSHCPRDCQILVPHAGTYDDPYEVGDDVEFIELSRRASPGTLIARALNECDGDVVHLLLPGCQATEGWCEAALEGFDDADVGCVAPTLIAANDPKATFTVGVRRGFGSRRVEVRLTDLSNDEALENSRTVGPTVMAGFYRRAALEQIGGWPAQLSLAAADLDVALSLAEIGYLPALETACPLACEASWASDIGAFQSARDTERLYWRHDHGTLGAMTRPITALVQCLTAGNPLRISLAMLGKVAGCFGIPAAVRHRNVITEATRTQLRVVHADASMQEDATHHRRAA